MAEHTNEKYLEQEEPLNNMSEPTVAYHPSVEHVQMTFDVPHTCDEKSFRLLMTLYAQQLIERSSQNKTHNHSLTDEQLEKELEGLSSFDGDATDITSQLNKEDYSHFMKSRKPMKGIAKWL